MTTATATDIKNHFGEYLEKSISEPVMVEKTGRLVAVILSIHDYERLAALEDKYWSKQAAEAEKKGYLGREASAKFLKSK